MKFKLTLPNGGELDFEGELDEFKALNESLGLKPDSLNVPAKTPPKDQEGSEGAGGGDEADATPATLDAGYVMERLTMVGANTDIERVTVIAQLAVEAGMAGADYPLTERLYTELGFRKPSRFTKAVANAKARNLIRTSGQGVWRPTYLGENYSRGLGRATRETRKGQRPQLSLHAGGEDDG
jgi:hypothetical protein